MRRSSAPLRFRSLVLSLAVAAGALTLGACDSGGDEPEVPTVEDLVVGTGETVMKNDSLTVTYAGRIQGSAGTFDDGTFTFKYGAGDVIDGFDRGFDGMKVGGRRRITIPPSIGYGDRDVRDPNTGFVLIPKNSTLVFEVDLNGLKRPAAN